MNTAAAIEVGHLSKIYEIFPSPLKRLLHLAGYQRARPLQRVAALDDVSFSVHSGEVVGIIGRNGSGKSTLLQCICQTIVPTSGSIRSTGQVAALLELGAGFNPEFTGRENVILNGSLLGLSRKKIDERMQSIAQFADLGEFFERQVKTYSSGMFLRLAFAVIAHVDAQILIIDEALAVGDVFFVQKCMRFLHQFRQQGTILFVSHDTAAVTGLCDRAIWLDNGRIRAQGATKTICEQYLGSKYMDQSTPPVEEAIGITLEPETKTSIFAHWDTPERFQMHSDDQGFGTGLVEILQVSLLNDHDQRLASIKGNEQVCLLIRTRALADLYSPIIGFVCKDRLGQVLFSENTEPHHGQQKPIIPKGSILETSFVFTMPLLAAGDYSLGVAVAQGTQRDHVQHVWIHDALVFSSQCPSITTGLVGIPMHRVGMKIL